MRKVVYLLMLVSTVTITACAGLLAPEGQWLNPWGSPVASQDDLQCRALANQAAMGAGSWTSVAPVQAAIRDNAAQQYYIQCIRGLGYQWVTTR